ncbi:MAG: DUF4129 domain-containing protein [Flavobacteriaceae bacterium]|nr:DUF4129 domain-containing protein [Flavobacteriaceae bacterium]
MNYKLVWFFTLFLLLKSGHAMASPALDSLRIDQTDTIQKRSFNNHLDDKYTAKAYDYDADLKEYKPSLWQRFKTWLGQKFQKLLSELFDVEDPGKAIQVIEYILKIGGILLIIFVLYKIIKSFLNEEGNWIFGRKSDQIDIIAHDLEQNLMQTDFDSLISEAIRNKQFRLAIRYYYLQSLKKLTQKNKIDWHYDKTNLDYEREIENAELKNKFRYISYLYNYCWYGEFDLNEQEFKTGEQTFHNFLNNL